MRIIEYINSLNNAYTFFFILGFLVAIYIPVIRFVKGSRLSKDQKRRFASNTRGFFVVLAATSGLILWADDIYRYILSLAALAAGVAIALKEVFLNMGGTFYRLFSKPFSVGDRVEIKGIRGDIIDVGFMSSQLLEVGPGSLTHQYTGRTITIPNSVLLTAPVHNENESAHHDDDFILHSFEVPIHNDHDWQRHFETMIECAKRACGKYEEKAFAFFKHITDKRQVDMPKIEPRISLKFKSTDEITMIVRISAPVTRRGTIEQEIIRGYLERVHHA